MALALAAFSVPWSGTGGRRELPMPEVEPPASRAPARAR